MIEGLRWRRLPATTARSIVTEQLRVGAEGPPPRVTAHVARLSFYRDHQLLRLSMRDAAMDATPDPDIYALWSPKGGLTLLDGSSGPVHDINDAESIALTSRTAPAYIRFFCFAVRDAGPFSLLETAPRAPEPATDHDRAMAAQARRLTRQRGDRGPSMLYNATVIYEGTMFQVRFSLLPDGIIEMVDDSPIVGSVPSWLVPEVPALGRPRSRARHGVKAVPASASERPPRGPRRRSGDRDAGEASPTVVSAGGTPATPTLVVLVELLLERALLAQTRNRLLEYFNALLPTTAVLDRFAALVADASPVIVIESDIEFVEETVARIVVGRIDESKRPSIDSVQLLPARGPALVLVPLQRGGEDGDVHRLAYDLSTRDLAAIVTCHRFSQLPEGLRRLRDVLLRFPDIDADLFATLFERVMGAPPPSGWDAAGTAWVKHVLHSDFEHPRRMGLGSADAVAFVRAQVQERLEAVEPVTGPGLADLHGMGAARAWAEDLISDIHAAMEGRLPWAQVDRGALLAGPPGTGKTTLARAIAKDCGVRFVVGSAAEWATAGTLGPHIEAIRRTFAEARRYAPSILFIDEIDSLGSRASFGGHNAGYQTDIVNAVLEQMQGLDPASPVVVIAATNHVEMVDAALRRSGRLDRTIPIPLPNSESLTAIYRYHVETLGATASDPAAVDLVTLGRLSVGMTGADVERIVRGAARRARKAGRAVVTDDLVAELTNRPRGSEARFVLSPEELERTATHEAGHALALFLSGSRGADIGWVTVVPRDDGTLGSVRPTADDRVHMTRAEFDDRIDVFLAGRAAEEIRYGDALLSSGASSDLQGATRTALHMITQVGLGQGRSLLWSATPSDVDLHAAQEMLAAAYARTLKRLTEHKALLLHLAGVLAERQELSGDEVRRALGA